jgi:phosphatidylinositol-3,4,5-trisphosphate 3-phosphatase and dual-specificity protein phosphatase PTEN
MDWLRKIVSGKRNRFKDEDYNLDITYVTKRVLGMSFPASGVESMYRNNINDVRQFDIEKTWCFRLQAS